jgi:thiamine transport system permease protein
MVLVPVAFLGLFFVFPLASVLDVGLRPGGSLDLRAVREVVTSPATRGVMLFTLGQATLSTVLTMVVGLPGAYALSRFRFPARRIVQALVLVPFVLPTVVVGSAFSGIGRGLFPLLVAHVFFNVAVVVRVVGGLWSRIDPEVEDAAIGLGAAGVRRFTRVMLPLSRPAIVGAATLVFLFTFTSFGVVVILGDPRLTTIEVEIFRQTTQLLNLPTAAALSILQLAVVSALLLGGALAETTGAIAQPLVGEAAGARHARTAGERTFVVLTVLGTLALVVLPPARLVVRSLLGPSGLTWDRYLELGSVRRGSALPVSPLDAIGTSLVFAAVASAIALVIGGLAAAAAARAGRGTTLRTLTALPLGASAVTVGFGYVVAFGRAPFELRGEPWLVPVAQAVVAIPFVVRGVAPVLASTQAWLAETAADLGASPARIARDVTLPIAAPALLAAAAFAAAISLGEFGATAFLARVDRPTITVAIFRLLSQPGAASVGQAMAMSSLLMVTVAGVAIAIDAVRARR